MKLITLLLMYLMSPLAAHGQVATQTSALAQMQQPGDASRYARVNPIFSPMVPYPEEALKKGIEGTVLVTIDVDSKGLVTNVEPVSGPPELFQAAIVKSLSPELDKVTIKSARKWKFKVIKRNENSGQGEFELPATFIAYCDPDS